MYVHWLEQTEVDVPQEGSWLSPKEAMCLSQMRFAKRRADWRLGRWTAKHAVAAYLNLPTDLNALADIEIRAESSGAPEVFLDDDPAEVAISLSHRAGIALCAIGSDEVSFGCDLETVEPRSDAFVADYFTASEKLLIERARDEEKQQLVALLWSTKESALKALRVGLRLDTTCVSVSLPDTGPKPFPRRLYDPFSLAQWTTNPDRWRPLHVCYGRKQVFSGWWRLQDHLLRTIVSAPPLQIPVRVQSTRLFAELRSGPDCTMIVPEA